MEKIGLYGGSFNPIHIGHLRAAEEICEIMALDKMLFIPTSIHPHKKEDKMLDVKIRLEMIKIACENNFKFEASDVEILRKGSSYTIDTLKHFSKNKENNYYFILGIENFLKISTWKNYKNLFRYSNFIVIFRPGYDNYNTDSLIPSELKKVFKLISSDKIKTVFEHRNSKKLFFLNIDGVEISSTELRDLIRNKQSIRYYVPDSLLDFITLNRFYVEN